MAGLIIFIIVDDDLLEREKVFVVSGLVSLHLPAFLIGKLLKKLVGQFSGAFKRHYAKRFPCLCVEEGGRHFTVIKKFKTAAAEAHTRRGSYGVSHAPINLDPDDQFLSVCAARVSNSDQVTPQESHARP